MSQDWLTLTCPNCQARFEVDGSRQKSHYACPKCQADITVPDSPTFDDEDTYSISAATADTRKPVVADQPATSSRTDDPKLHRWVCRIDDNEVGPISYQQMRKLALAGTLSRDAKVRKADGDQWQAANSIAALFEPRKKKPKPEPPPESRPGYEEMAPYEDVPGIVVFYGKLIMFSSATIGILNAAGVLVSTLAFGHKMHALTIIAMWVTCAIQSYIWFVCYKLGGGLMYGEKSAVQGLAVLLGVFLVVGVILMFNGGGLLIAGIVVCAISLILFTPPLVVAFQHKEVFE